MQRVSDQKWREYQEAAARVEALGARIDELARPFASHSPDLAAALTRVENRKAQGVLRPFFGLARVAEAVVHLSDDLSVALDEHCNAVLARGEARRAWRIAVEAEKTGNAAGVA